MQTPSRVPACRAAGALLALLFLAAAATTPASATSTSQVVTEVAGLAAKAVTLATNKSGLVTPVKVMDVEEFAYPSKLAVDALKRGMKIKCGAGVGLCPIGHCCR